jgi:hypothetical protein
MSHLDDNAMTYWQHWRFAAYHGAVCIWSGVLLLVHAFVPAWFQEAGSTLVRRLGESFDQGKEKHGAESNAHF